jgi:hypothetical protein
MKPVVFKLKHKPAEDRHKNQEWRNYAVREFPKLPAWVYIAGFAILAIGIGIGSWLGHPGIGLLVGVTACVILVIVAQPLRCPQCRGNVMTREIEEENGLKRFFHDCPTCRITWRCEQRHWDSSDD